MDTWKGAVTLAVMVLGNRRRSPAVGGLTGVSIAYLVSGSKSLTSEQPPMHASVTFPMTANLVQGFIH